MAANRFPTLYLSRIFFFEAASEIISTIPLKPTSGIIRMNPTFSLPFLPRLTRLYFEEINLEISARRGARPRKPFFLILICLPFKIITVENAKLEHLFRREIGCELGIKLLTHLCYELVAIFLLERVADSDTRFFHSDHTIRHIVSFRGVMCLLQPKGQYAISNTGAMSNSLKHRSALRG